MTIKLNRENDFHVNEKRVLRLMRILQLKSICRRRRKNYVKSTPEITAENILNREFHAEHFGEQTFLAALGIAGGMAIAWCLADLSRKLHALAIRSSGK